MNGEKSLYERIGGHDALANQIAVHLRRMIFGGAFEARLAP